MFEQAMVDGVKRSNPWSFAASITMQSVLVGAALVLPVMHVAQMETRPPDILFLPRPLNSGEHVKQAPAQGGAPTSSAILHADRIHKVFQWPSRIPDRVSPGPDMPNAPIYDFGAGGGSGVRAGIPTGVPGIEGPELPAPPPPAPKPVQVVKPSGPVVVGGDVQAAKLLRGPKPPYPALAKNARISGTVKLAALISTDGHIRNLRLLSGHPMLAPAAIDAVSQWVYKPTLLNGLPVEVLTEIEVNFILQ